MDALSVLLLLTNTWGTVVGLCTVQVRWSDNCDISSVKLSSQNVKKVLNSYWNYSLWKICPNVFPVSYHECHVFSAIIKHPGTKKENSFCLISYVVLFYSSWTAEGRRILDNMPSSQQ